MPNRIVDLCCLLLLIPASIYCQAPPIGQWRDHLPYHQAIAVAGTAEKIWCATPWSIFSIDIADKNIERYSKINGLSETGISTIGLQETGGKLVVAYTNSQVDVIAGGGIHSIDAIKNSSMAGNKTIHQLLLYGQQAYLSTGLGIVVIDLEKYEVKDTYVIGDAGQQTKVNGLATDGQYFYAATEEGLKKASVNGSNLSDFRHWEKLSGQDGLPAGSVAAIAFFQHQLVALKDDSLWLLANGQWNFWYANEWTIQDLHTSGGKLLLSEEQPAAGRVVSLTAQGTIDEEIRHAAFTRYPRQAIFAGDQYWIADTLSGLSQYAAGRFESWIPNSPYSIATGPLQVLNHTLWSAAGAVTGTWSPAHNKDGLFSLANDNWTLYHAGRVPQLDSFPDIVSLAIDPQDGSVWAGSFGGGLLHIQAGQPIETYKQNSPLQPAYFDPGSYRVSGLAIDAAQHLWIANYGGPQALSVKKKDGSWRSFFIPYTIPENAVGPVLVDEADQKWIIAPNGNGLLCFNHGQSIDNPGDDRWKWYRAGKGNGNLPHDDVLSMAKDKNGFVWVGTRQGIGIIQCPQEVFTAAGCEAILPVVQQDNFAGYLFRDEQVQCMAVDGADRKWMGTKNGVWLISADGSKIIYRFTAANSPLLSDDVRQVAIDGQNGEVFFATSKGLCSFRSTATEGNTANSEVLVFPNPVPPGYTGTIAIRGIANNAIVKIAEMDGRLVYQTRALGGQAVWNGKDYKGRIISTGVYLVLVSDDNKQEKTVSKIVFIKK